MNPQIVLFQRSIENLDRYFIWQCFFLSGQLIWENEIGHATTFVPGEDLPAGLYLLKWNSERQQGSVLLQKMGRYEVSSPRVII